VVVQITRNLSRSATDIARQARVFYAIRKPVEQLPVEWLVPQFVIDMSRILVGRAVITRLNLSCLLLCHHLVLEGL
jgi:hypothetical protein